MTDISGLEREITRGARCQRCRRGALEEVRVAALGKKGSISELLKTLGAMRPTSAKSRARCSTACATA